MVKTKFKKAVSLMLAAVMSLTAFMGIGATTAFAAVGEKDTSYAHREKIAKANGVAGYKGTAAQNTGLLNLLKQGKLKKA